MSATLVASITAIHPIPALGADFFAQARLLGTVTLWGGIVFLVLFMTCLTFCLLWHKERRLRRWTQRRNDDARQALESVPCGVALIDSDGALTLRNRPFSLLGPEVAKELFGPRMRGTPRLREGGTTQRVVSREGESFDISMRRIPGSGAFLIANPVAEPNAPKDTDDSLSDDGLSKALDRYKDLLKTVLDGSARGMALFDKDRNIIASNDRLFELYDLPKPEDASSITLDSLIDDCLDKGTVLFGAKEDFRKGRRALAGSAREEVAQDYLSDGRVIMVRHRPLPDGGSLMIFEDATGGYASQRQLDDAQKEADQAHRAKTDFFANVTHELRTPLNAIIGFSEIIKDELFGEVGNGRYRQYADDIHESGSRLLQLINDILDLSQIEAGRFELQEETVAVPVVFDSVLRSVRDKAQARAVRLRLDIAPGLPDLRADPRSLRQILLNLLSDAVRFTEAEAEVVVRLTATQEGCFNVTVKSGTNHLSETEFASAMEPFGTGDSAWKGRDRQAGLGLPLTRHLVELHGGTLSLDPDCGDGSALCITFPADRSVYRAGQQERSGPAALPTDFEPAPADRDPTEQRALN